MPAYDPKKIEQKWQKKWLEEKVFKASDGSRKPKYYQLETFPYPSAAGLHVGHPKGYIAEDIHARYMRMRGKEVLYTMGWDAFGLPTENYAIKVGKSPKVVAEENTKNFKRQVQMFGLSYDWDREISTANPEYYKWTQWLFIQLYKKGLAYQAKGRVNWCPKDQTVLANEQVINGRCERCGTEIEEREMTQWFLKITDYAERLLGGLKGLDWPASTVKRQEDWIGKSEGAEISFLLDFKKNPADNDRRGPDGERAALRVFTTRPDTLFGATYLVVAPEHPWVKLAVDDKHDVLLNKAEVRSYVEAAKHKTELMRKETEKEKTGVELQGVKAINPANGEEISMWIADYVLGSYGTGAIMAVPAHDERDFAFAKKFGLPIRQVIMPHIIDEKNPPQKGKENTTRNIVHALVKHPKENKFIALRSKKMPWLTPITGGIEEGESALDAALREIKEETGYTSAKFVKELPLVFFAEFYAAHKDLNRAVTSHVLYFELKNLDREPVSKEEDELHTVEWLNVDKAHLFTPVGELEYMAKWLREGDFAFPGEGILMNSGKFNGMDSEKAKWEIVKAVGAEKKVQYKLRDWSVSRQRYWGVPIPMIHCPNDGIVPVPDKDLPVVLPDLEDYRPRGMAPLASSEKFMNVKCPQCGGTAKRDPETFDTFVDSSWYYLRYADPHNSKEIFEKKKAKHWLPVDLYVIGAEHTVLHLLYSRFITKFLYDEGYLNFEEPFLKLRHQGLIRGNDGQKMSKSIGNVVNPDEIVGEFGADTVRLYEMFMGPFEDGAPWDPKGILGVERFLKRFWNYVNRVLIEQKGKAPSSKKPLLYKTIKKVGDDIENFKFNTAISSLMILLNALEEGDQEEGIKFTILDRENLETLIKLLHPFAPHMAQELWQLMGHGDKDYLDFESWPNYDPKLLAEEKITLVFQVDSKTRDTVQVDAAITEGEAKKLALENAKVKGVVGAQVPKKIIYVEKKLVNIVL